MPSPNLKSRKLSTMIIGGFETTFESNNLISFQAIFSRSDVKQCLMLDEPKD